jgi:hypothetical protein
LLLFLLDSLKALALARFDNTGFSTIRVRRLPTAESAEGGLLMVVVVLVGNGLFAT